MTARDAEILFGAYLDALVTWARCPEDVDGELHAKTERARADYHAALEALAPGDEPSASSMAIGMLRDVLGRRDSFA